MGFTWSSISPCHYTDDQYRKKESNRNRNNKLTISHIWYFRWIVLLRAVQVLFWTKFWVINTLSRRLIHAHYMFFFSLYETVCIWFNYSLNMLCCVSSRNSVLCIATSAYVRHQKVLRIRRTKPFSTCLTSFALQPVIYHFSLLRL